VSGVIGAEEREVTREATVDDARSLTLVATSTEDLELRLRLPDGSTLSAEEGASAEREWHSFRGNGERGAELLPGVGSGYNTLVRIQSPPRGAYGLWLVRRRETGQPAPFAVTVVLESDLRLGTWLQSPRVLRGAPAAISAVITDAGQPAPEAVVYASFTREAADDAVERAGESVLRDDGREPDAQAGDGLYTGLFVPPAEGRFWMAVRATGTTRAGDRFERSGGLLLLASEPTVEVHAEQESYWTRNDADAVDGLVVPLVLEGRPGAYDVVVELRAGNGRSVTASRTLTLRSRTETTVSFASAALRPLAVVDGDYEIQAVEVVEVGTEGRVVRGRRAGLGRTPFLRIADLAQD
jgi:hypothetical protein